MTLELVKDETSLKWEKLLDNAFEISQVQLDGKNLNTYVFFGNENKKLKEYFADGKHRKRRRAIFQVSNNVMFDLLKKNALTILKNLDKKKHIVENVCCGDPYSMLDYPIRRNCIDIGMVHSPAYCQDNYITAPQMLVGGSVLKNIDIQRIAPKMLDKFYKKMYPKSFFQSWLS